MITHLKTLPMSLVVVLACGLAGTAAMTPAHAASTHAVKQAPNGYDAPQGDTWASIAKLPDWQGIWQLDWESGGASLMPPKPPLTAKAQAEYAVYKAGQKKGEFVQPQTANCLPPGMPQIMTQPYPIEFLYTPGQIAIDIEAYMQVRHIYTDGRKLPKDPDPLFMGTSVGHWEGDTLVVKSVGFVPWSKIAPGVGHSKDMQIIERFRKVDPKHMHITTTIIDPQVLSKPWTITRTYVKLKGGIEEYECEQNNRDSATALGRPGIELKKKPTPASTP